MIAVDILIGLWFNCSGVDDIADARPLGVIPPHHELEDSTNITQSILPSHVLRQKAMP